MQILTHAGLILVGLGLDKQASAVGNTHGLIDDPLLSSNRLFIAALLSPHVPGMFTCSEVNVIVFGCIYITLVCLETHVTNSSNNKQASIFLQTNVIPNSTAH